MQINQKLEYWKNRLLDLSKRNRLINCALPKPDDRISRTSLLIYTPSPNDLWNIFAENDSSLTFPIPTDEVYGSDEISQPPKPQEPKNYYGIKTNQSPVETCKTLRSLMKKAKEFTEEKGLNALYLAFGFLNWHENDTGELRSPLLLVPVTLAHENLNEPIMLSRFDEEIIVNNALEQKLLNDFGIHLPQFDESGNWQDYLLEVEKACFSLKGRVESDTCQLTLFSFLKMNMYRDLESNADKISSHPIIRALNGESSGSNADYSDIDSFDHDSSEPLECFSVVDADSSQQDAILLAKRGTSFVLQGPPGTGKSQTITNIIAELMADGKKVLFVSEKMAALEVVHKRLQQTNLGNFCLTLHSHNAKRREVLDQLDTSIKLSKHKVQLQQEAYNKLHQLKETRMALNQYATELHTVVMPLGMTIYQVNGMLAKFSQHKNIDYTQSDAGLLTPEQFAKCEYALEELARIVSKSGYQQNNPWNGYFSTNVTHEFRQQFMADSTVLLSSISNGRALFTALNALLATSTPICSISSIPLLSELNNLVERFPGMPFEWLSSDLSERAAHLNACHEALLNRNSLVKDINARYEIIKKNYAISGTCKTSTESGQALQNAIDGILPEYNQDILSLESATMLKRYQTSYRSGLRTLNPSYQKDRKTLLGFCKTASKMDYPDALILLGKLNDIATLNELLKKQTEAEALRKKLAILHSKYENERKILSGLLSLPIDEKFDFTAAKMQLDWARKFSDMTNRLNIDTDFMRKVCHNKADILASLKSCVTALSEWSAAMQLPLNGFTALFDKNNEKRFKTIPLTELERIVKACVNNFAALEFLIDYKNAESRLVELNLGDYLAKAKEHNLSGDEIVPVFRKCFYRSWLDAIVPQYPAVHSFRRLRQSDTIERFKTLDKSQMEIAKAALVAKLMARLPSFDSVSASSGEVALLRREMAKQRKLMPIRKLVAAIPNLLPVLKPCIMMSPLSVSTYLGNSDYEFDTVIFDEASQIQTEDAIGAIFRAKQTIIAGDNKQLPPTNFFSSAISDSGEFSEDEEGEINDTGAYESLLDEAAILPTQTLLWHYRSKHEHLIAFSNAKIYQGSLITFPSSVEQADGVGVEYTYVTGGIYDRGGRNGNRKEAEKIAEIVFEHFQTHPNRSLGIIAFGLVQQTAIEDAIIRKRREYPQYEAFFSEKNEESLFIKNLETVQGDERDTIILGIGYAPDSAGKLIMHFGPINNEGGERRLNVAVTRARYNLKLVGSILPTDINLGRISGKGPQLLRLYIDFAINGIRAILGETSEHAGWFDSPFEEAVFGFLTANGYDVATQVGCSGYRIDLAIRHPRYNGRFAIGIECDGAAYHSSRTARERDRLRQTILEDMGWTIYRVWSTDWIKDQHTEGERLLNAIKQAIDSYREVRPAARHTPAAKLTDFINIRSKTDQEALQEKHDHIQSLYAGSNANEVPMADFEKTMLCVISSGYGLDKTALFKETAQYGYHWQRQGSTIKEKFEQAYRNLLQNGNIIEEDGKIKFLGR